jgi:hypothetical protein
MAVEEAPWRAPLSRVPLTWVRALVGCLGAGLLVGIIVAGLGSRLAMRLVAAANPDADGTLTENGNVVGEITLEGTLDLVLFTGIPVGLLAGLVVFFVRRWLPAAMPWRGLALTLPLLALFGPGIFDSESSDFRLLEPAELSVAVFGVLFPLAGLALAPLADELGPGVPSSFYRRDVTLIAGVAIAVLTGVGLLFVGLEVADIL